MVTRRKAGFMAGAVALVTLVLTVPATASPSATTTDCRSAPQGAACELKWAGRKSGIAIGASIAEGIPEEQRTDIETHFTAVSDENAFKWSSMEPSEGVVDFSDTDALVEWAEEKDLRLRAHVLFWHRLQTPAWVRQTVEAAPDPVARLTALMTERVEEVVGRYRGRVAIIDVVNEPLETFGPGWDTADSLVSAENFFYTTLGEQYIDVAFRAAREADPRARLALNETVWNPVIGDPKADAFLDLVSRLRERGVPIDTVGLQTHGMFGVTPPFFPGSTDSFRRYMDALGALGVKVEITELDVALPFLKTAPDPLAAQAALYEKVVLACARSRHCTGVTTWNIRDDDTWLDRFPVTAGNAPNEPLLLDAEGRPKPAYGAVRTALLERCNQPWAKRPDSGACSTHWPYLSPNLATAPQVRWKVNGRTDTVFAETAARDGVGHRLTAALGRKSRVGVCKTSGSSGRVLCSIRLTPGLWKISVEKRIYGVSGPASDRSVRIR